MHYIRERNRKSLTRSLAPTIPLLSRSKSSTCYSLCFAFTACRFVSFFVPPFNFWLSEWWNCGFSESLSGHRDGCLVLENRSLQIEWKMESTKPMGKILFQKIFYTLDFKLDYGTIQPNHIYIPLDFCILKSHYVNFKVAFSFFFFFLIYII